MNCIICFDKLALNHYVKLECNHNYCINCFVKHMRLDNRCGFCRTNLCEKASIDYKELSNKINNTLRQEIDEKEISENLFIEIVNYSFVLISKFKEISS